MCAKCYLICSFQIGAHSSRVFGYIAGCSLASVALKGMQSGCELVQQMHSEGKEGHLQFKRCCADDPLCPAPCHHPAFVDPELETPNWH